MLKIKAKNYIIYEILIIHRLEKFSLSIKVAVYENKPN